MQETLENILTKLDQMKTRCMNRCRWGNQHDRFEHEMLDDIEYLINQVKEIKRVFDSINDMVNI